MSDHAHDDIVYPDAIPFILVHIACLAAFWTGVPLWAVALAITLYFVRMFGVVAGYHRYFSHRAFTVGRVTQFLLAFLAQTSSQKGVLWWAAKHRHHHKHSDTEDDVHSPRHHGMWYSHVGWILGAKHSQAELEDVPDLTRYPELVWLTRYHYVPPFTLGFLCWLFGGWPGLVVGFFWSTVALWHGTFTINSLAHGLGSKRYVTGDDSRNNVLLAFITLGEGWHNNHHAYMSSARQGFRWWELDPAYYVLRGLKAVGVVHSINEPPADVVRGERRIARGVLDKAARQLAQSWHDELERAVAAARAKLPHAPSREELRAAATHARERFDAWVAEHAHPHLPSVEELRARARRMFANTPSLDDVARRAREMISERLHARLLAEAQGAA
jgi:stearoyl-CoA desaturase (delta-9 desaturase)